MRRNHRRLHRRRHRRMQSRGRAVRRIPPARAARQQRSRTAPADAPADLDRRRPVLGADGRSRRHDVRAGQARRLKPRLPPPAPEVQPRLLDIGAARATNHEGEVRAGGNGVDPDRDDGPTGRHAAGLRPSPPTQERTKPRQGPTRAGCRPNPSKPPTAGTRPQEGGRPCADRTSRPSVRPASTQPTGRRPNTTEPHV